jgi:two-component system response regulator HydG
MKVPPLRERREDIPLFAQFFLDKANLELKKEVLGFDEAVMRIFFAYQWPGNLREFKNVVRRAVLLTAGSLVMPETLPQEIREPMAHSEPLGSIQAESPGSPTTDLKDMIEKNERETILRTLEQVKYNKSKAARLLNIDRKTLYNKLKLYDIDA